MTPDTADILEKMDLWKHSLETDQTLSNVIENQKQLIEIITDQEERISYLNKIIYDLFPEIEIIETAADNDEERKLWTQRYLNLNENYMKG